MLSRFLPVFALSIVLSIQRLPAADERLPTLEEALAAKQDVWGLAAMRQPNGPSYDFFEKVLPPLRYVNAEFRYYPIVLSAPNATNKARLVSNGSAINARANLKTWKEPGVPVRFGVGHTGEVFGADLNRLRGPHYERGYLPVVQMTYESGGAVYEQESFASVESPFANHGVVFTEFTLTSKKPGRVSAVIETNTTISNGTVRDTNGHVLVWFSPNWKWQETERALLADLTVNQSATLAIATQPMPSPTQIPFLSAAYEKQHERCVDAWEKLLGRAMQMDVPEPLVNNAWRALLANNFMLLKADRANYSAGNQYERLYQAECGDAARAFLLFGYGKEALPMLSHQFDYTRESLEFHNAGFKLQQFAHWYWVTRDKAGVEALRPKWEKEIKLIIEGREKDSGIFPKERYCGDIAEKVYSLNPNANCWRGLRDFAGVLEEVGEGQRAKELFAFAQEFRAAILKAIEKSEYRDAQPPFIPIQLFGKEKPYEHLTSTMVGSYWNLLAPYVIGSGVFGLPGCERDRWMVDYLHEHGGIGMGMIRFHQHSGLFACEDALDDLYGLRYSIKLLQLDEVDRALVSFYGKLAQGLTRDTFIGAEGTGLRALSVGGASSASPQHEETLGTRGTRPSEDVGRPMYLPPNSTAHAYFLWMLRYLLVQDWDMDDDGKPETLRLAFATPKRWLEDGKQIKVERAPTAFGELSLKIVSRLSQGEVIAEVDLPKRNPPKQTLLRVRVPDGWRIVSANVDKNELKPDNSGTVDISKLKEKGSVRFQVAKSSEQ